jgi:hypothetical protein
MFFGTHTTQSPSFALLLPKQYDVRSKLLQLLSAKVRAKAKPLIANLSL